MMSMSVISPKLQTALLHAVRTQASRPMSVLSKQSAEDYKKKDYNARMQATGRPVSPHVTIYAFPIGAISSITNRVTGMALSMGAAGLGCAEIVGGSGTALSLMQTVGSSGMILTAVAKFSVSFPIVYHYAGALRHLGWDSKPDYLTLDFVEKSSYYLFGGSLAVCGGLAIFV